MPDEKPEFRALTREELDSLAGEALPERAAMSLINANLAAPVNAPDEEREPIVTQQPEQEQEQALSQDELEAQGGEELPDREAMSLVNANIAVPVNAAVAANVLSDDAVAYADATQDAYIDQSQ